MIRTTTHTVRLTAPVHCSLDAFLRQQTVLWNAALEERIAAHRPAGTRMTTFDQFKSLTEIRQDDAAFERFPVAVQRSVPRSLDNAFKAFFDRVRKKKRPGFPRFKLQHRGVRSFDIPDPVVRKRSSGYALHVKGLGRIGFRDLPAGSSWREWLSRQYGWLFNSLSNGRTRRTPRPGLSALIWA